MSETALGRMTRKSPVGAFAHFGKKKVFKVGGWLNAVIPMLIVPYYSTIGGWVVKYLVEYFKGNVQKVSEDGYFGSFIADSWQAELWFIVFAVFVFAIILGGVQNGIERMSRIMMPVLVILAVVVTIYSVTRPGALEGEIFPHPQCEKLLLDDGSGSYGTDVLFPVHCNGNLIYLWFLCSKGYGY